jgi:dTDP-4-amino-4,6-dideoxygalactose transaminase
LQQFQRLFGNLVRLYLQILKLIVLIYPLAIEAKITDTTSAIIATHVFGNPCDLEAIQNLARKHNLKAITSTSL